MSSKTSVPILASVSLPAGQTKSSATPSSSVDLRAYYGGGVGTYKLTNGGTAPTVLPLLQIQVSDDNTLWYDFGSPFAGDITNSSVNSNSFLIPAGIMYMRTIAYNHATTAVTGIVTAQMLTP